MVEKKEWKNKCSQPIANVMGQIWPMYEIYLHTMERGKIFKNKVEPIKEKNRTE